MNLETHGPENLSIGQLPHKLFTSTGNTTVFKENFYYRFEPFTLGWLFQGQKKIEKIFPFFEIFEKWSTKRNGN